MSVCRAHPRIRGEYPERSFTTLNPQGSPPHTRGILHDGRYRCLDGGLTPAYAGNTVSLSACKTHTQGSPPHTRGILDYDDPMVEANGLTPAYAGNTNLPYIISTDAQAHPRIRGEYTAW